MSRPDEHTLDRASAPFALLDRGFGAKGWRLLTHSRSTLIAASPDEVPSVVQAAESAAESGYHVAGFVTYEAASGLSPHLLTHSRGSLPLAWFGVFETVDKVSDDQLRPQRTVLPPDWQASISKDDFRLSIDKIKNWIEAGDTYQVNYTYRLRSRFSDSPLALFRQLAEAQRGELNALIDTGHHAICSASPELFFDFLPDDDGALASVRCEPMKGTRPRGRVEQEDDRLRSELVASEKERAENLMIVDMVRNDLGVIAEAGSVRATPLFDVRVFPSVLQMVSTVTARTRASRAEVLSTLFPSASITGAPKLRTMELIRELEPDRRGIYTGAVGWFGPGGEAVFNVAIRTVHVDRQLGMAEYGTGGGITWDSLTELEWQESLTKTSILNQRQLPPGLFETLLWTPDRGFFLLDRHLDRMARSAARLHLDFDHRAGARRLATCVRGLERRQRVRLELSAGGVLRATCRPFAADSRTWRLNWADKPVDSSDLRLHHKCLDRQPYDSARRQPGCDDVLLFNERGEVTESTVANLVIVRAGRLLTPSWQSGLLRGTLRQELLERRILSEAVIDRDQLGDADGLFLINSLRGWIRAEIVSNEPDSSV